MLLGCGEKYSHCILKAEMVNFLLFVDTQVNCRHMLLFLGDQRLYFCAICGAVHFSICTQAAIMMGFPQWRILDASLTEQSVGNGHI